MQSQDLIKARQEAKNTIRQRIRCKTEEIERRTGSSSEENEDASFEDTIEPEEVFACTDDEGYDYFKIGCGIVLGFITFYCLFW